MTCNREANLGYENNCKCTFNIVKIGANVVRVFYSTVPKAAYRVASSLRKLKKRVTEM